ncbi:hypothetical protein EYF80_064835 [Liparis tanakae]|uniref:Uncharacterized protein n=1 Tax=Liparis tanakae TaxID=230148 RepID=A0A4Z2E8A5_9TELE|nr:hypothetical protein EYF80_064835 [Liparis tanakae]
MSSEDHYATRPHMKGMRGRLRTTGVTRGSAVRRPVARRDVSTSHVDTESASITERTVAYGRRIMHQPAKQKQSKT